MNGLVLLTEYNQGGMSMKDTSKGIGQYGRIIGLDLSKKTFKGLHAHKGE